MRLLKQIEGGDSIEMRKEYTAQVSFTNTFHKTLSGAVLTVEGFGLLQDKQEARQVCQTSARAVNHHSQLTVVFVVCLAPRKRMTRLHLSCEKRTVCCLSVRICSPGMLSGMFVQRQEQSVQVLQLSG